jgi:hypothetical protein
MQGENFHRVRFTFDNQKMMEAMTIIITERTVDEHDRNKKRQSHC